MYLWDVCMYVYMYVSKYVYVYTMGKILSVQIKYKYGWPCEKYRNKDGMKTQEDCPAAEKSWYRNTGRLLYH